VEAVLQNRDIDSNPDTLYLFAEFDKYKEFTDSKLTFYGLYSILIIHT